MHGQRRTLVVPMEKYITDFQSKVKQGPEFVCICCHCLMYKLLFLVLKASTQNVAMNCWSKSLVLDISTCDAALKRGNMPLQAKANGLQLCPIPNQLSGLNMLELRLISLRVPFMKMVALPSGKQRCIHGPAVNVPSKVDTVSVVYFPVCLQRLN